ncbi:MAG: type VII secretion protein EssC [Lachnospiraceae bacterium]|nr:type VII secretion protein EssC [Lachnospiraceae bacterium]
MRATLISKEKLLTVNLPDICKGKYWFVDDETDTRLLGIEADEYNNRWVIKGTLTITLYDSSSKEVSELVLKKNDINRVRFGANSDNTGFLYVEDCEAGSNSFIKYEIIRNGEVTIGRSSSCDVSIANNLVSSVHAKLSFTNGICKLTEESQSNGIYVNGVRFSGSDILKFGSCIYILGVKIIVGNGIIAINNPNGTVRLSGNCFKKLIADTYIDNDYINEKEEQYYYRSPRFIRKIESLDLKVDMPTQAEKVDDTPILLTLAPSMVMGIASFATGIITLTNTLNSSGSFMSALPTLIMSLSMLIGMIVFPFIMKKRDIKNKKNKEIFRRNQYMKYLSSLKQEVEKNKRKQIDILTENNPHIMDKSRQDNFWKTGLWSKSKNDEDYLFIRLGIGELPMAQNIIYPEERFSLEDDEMREALFEFQREKKVLKNVPVGIDLKNIRCVGITGANNNIVNAINLIGMQIGLLHGYDEVKIAFFGKESDLNKLGYLKDINHIWDDAKSKRYLATNEDDARELASEINKIILKRREKDSLAQNPYIIVMIADRNLAKAVSFVDEVQDTEDNLVRIIYCYDDGGELPRECESIVKLEVSSGLMYGKDIDNYNGINFVQDVVKTDECKNVIQKSMKYKISMRGGENSLPDKYDFMEMFKVGKAEHLNIIHRWESNNPVQSLKTEVGIDTNGNSFYLDLHEKAHGPHGLVAGMTGSGKSEFIISYILSMAINYHPDEVAFVLIDYKGGGLADAFDKKAYKLPHLAGTITNLDTGAVYRSMLAINGELKRRQNVFKEVKLRFNEATMDIYKYQKMYRDGMVSEPMPHLFIISDEFAELKDQQPEFMDELISTARIGRSLGVHLILATQKPNGVVNDQIWANSKFKVCLKVQDKMDSMEMLKRPDAAELTNIGRFYLQVGYNELFVMGQSAWSGAMYPDTEEYVNEGEKDVEVINELGNTVEKIKFNKNDISKNNGEQIVRIIEYLVDIAKVLKYKQRQLWLPEIPEKIYLDELIAKYGLPDTDNFVAIAGELDDPYTQSQRLLTVDFEEKGNAIVYGNSTSGIDIFLETTLFSMFEIYSPMEFNAYILDFENENLKKFKNVPHVGDILKDGENEKINNLYLMLNEEIKKRRKLLSDFGGDITSYNATVEEKLPKILVVINNYAHYAESYEKLENQNIALSRDGSKYGIYFMLTGASASDIRYKITQNFGQNFVLKLNDPTDYTAVLGSVNGRTPEKYAGRGMIKNKEVFMFQSARFTYESDSAKVNEYIDKFCLSQKNKYGDYKARKIPVMPEILGAESFEAEAIRYHSVPIGINYKNYNVVNIDFTNNFMLGVVSKQLEESNRFVLEMTNVLSKITNSDIRILNGCKDAVFDSRQDGIYEYSDLNAGFEEIYEICKTRNNEYKQGIKKIFEPMFIVLNSYTKLKQSLNAGNTDRMTTMLNIAAVFWNVYFIIADDSQLITNNSAYDWYKEKIMNNCVWIGDGINGYLSYMGMRGKNIKDTVNNGSGYYCRNGKSKYVKFIAVREEEEEDE